MMYVDLYIYFAYLIYLGITVLYNLELPIGFLLTSYSVLVFASTEVVRPETNTLLPYIKLY